MRKAVYDIIDKYVIRGITVAPMHVGSGQEREGILIHPDTGLPYVQAAGIAGVLRSYCDRYDSGLTGSLFGDALEDTESKLRITDLTFIANQSLQLEVRPHVKISKESGTAADNVTKDNSGKSGQKFNMQYVGAGAEFVFSMYLYDTKEEQKEVAHSFLESALCALHMGELQIGGKKSNGCGDVRFISIKHKQYDMTDTEDRRKWLSEKEDDLEEVRAFLESAEKTKTSIMDAYRIIAKVTTEDELLVKGIAVTEFGKDAPKAANMKNAAGNYIVPGSSLKGTIKNRAEMIAQYIHVPESVFKEGFGCEENGTSKGMPSRVYFHDVEVGAENGVQTKKHHRIHIDKFTGGVINGGLFTELAIAGDLEIQISVKKNPYAEEAAALLMLALRDLGMKLYSIGSGQSIGRGYVDVHNIEIRDLRTGKICVLKEDFSVDQQSTTDEELPKSLLSSLQTVCNQER